MVSNYDPLRAAIPAKHGNVILWDMQPLECENLSPDECILLYQFVNATPILRTLKLRRTLLSFILRFCKMLIVLLLNQKT